MAVIEYQGLKNVYTYMGWQLITDKTSQQYKLREQAGQNFDNEGFGKIGDRYVIACCERYGKIGDYIDWVLANGSTLKTIMGDEKSSSDPNNNGWGHVYGNSISVVEFVVDKNAWYPNHANPGTSSCHPEWAGQIKSYTNSGSYFNGDNPGTTGSGSGIGFVSATRYLNGNTTTVWFVGTMQADGLVYFNDDTFYRCSKDGSHLQVYSQPKQIWVDSQVLINLKCSILDLTAIDGAVGGILSGSGASNPNASVESAVKWMINKASTNNITYSQSNRNLKNPNGSSYDCSSFVITGFTVGGFDIDASYTGNMRSGFEKAGFKWHPADNDRKLAASQLQRGDILLNTSKHTQVYIGNNQDVNCGSTPARVMSHVAYYSGGGWDGFLRYGA